MKKVILGLAVALVALASQASFLYWQIDTTQLSGPTAGTYSFNGHDITGVRVVAVEGGTYTWPATAASSGGSVLTTHYKTDTGSYTTTENASVAIAKTKNVYADLSTFVDGNETAYTYYIEIMGHDSFKYGDSVGVIGVSEGLTYASAAGNITESLGSFTTVPAAWTGGTYAAPEPTSGLLLLVGASLLALKRRKV